jgi:hypothetical protein
MEKFMGNMEPGEIFGPYVVQLNTRLRREATAFISEHGGKLEGYLYGKYKRGWIVVALNADSTTANRRSSP